MHYCIMAGGGTAGCGSAGEVDVEDLLTLASDDSTHEGYGGKFAIGGTRVTFGDEGEAAFAALTAGLSPTMNVDPSGTDTEVCDERTFVAAAASTDPEDDEEDGVVIHINRSSAFGVGGGFLGDEEGSIFGIAGDHITEGRRARSLVPCC